MKTKRTQARINFEQSMSSLLSILIRTKGGGVYQFCEDHDQVPMTMYRYMSGSGFDYFKVYALISLFGPEYSNLYMHELQHAMMNEDYQFMDGVEMLRGMENFNEQNVNELQCSE